MKITPIHPDGSGAAEPSRRKSHREVKVDINDRAYVLLQRHLHQKTFAFPATKSRAEIKILKQIFTPEEALAATCLTHRYEPFETILERAGHWVDSPETLMALLDRLDRKGGIGVKIKDGRKSYCNLPLVVGFFETQLGKMTPEFIQAFETYTSDRKFGLEFISTALPQMRTIPISKSITPEHTVSTFDEVAALLRTAEPPYVIFECICRQKKALLGHPCQTTQREETCLAVGTLADGALRRGKGRSVTRNEMMSILEQNQKDGLVLQPSNTRQAEFVCSCCGCCCGMLSMQKQLPKPVDFWASNFQAAVDEQKCNGCGNCEKRCQVNAVTVPENTRQATVDLNRCIGCGLCVAVCPNQALSLVKKSAETQPPEDGEALYDTIMSNKKGAWGKLKVGGKLVIDAIVTGQTRLLK